MRALIPNLEKFDEALDMSARKYNISRIDKLTEKAFSEDSIIVSEALLCSLTVSRSHENGVVVFDT